MRICFANHLLHAGKVLSLVPLFLIAVTATHAAEEKIDFDRQVRPILSEHCYRCHGPDANDRKAGLRLDLAEGAIAAAESGKVAVVPGKPDASELVARIFSADQDVVMPPPDINKPLSAEQKEVLKKWIAGGAKYQKHWSFVPPVRPATPNFADRAATGWNNGPVDALVRAKMLEQGLSPAAEADRTLLVRRLSLDLTGLLPAIETVEKFATDKSPDAVERLVDELMASPFYGERMAVDWLDAARYADTHGYHIDSGRDMTRWREYVIDAFSQGMPYDQFTLEQLAGDLMPESADAETNFRRKLASGFQRNNMINFEGGAIPQEYLNAYIVDRVNTLGTVYLGMTVGCCQCHDHKYDPITQKDFYQLYAFFNAVPENGLDGSKGNAAPMMPAPTRLQLTMQAQLEQEIASLEKELASPSAQVDAEQAAWEKVALSPSNRTWSAVVANQLKAASGAELQQQDGVLRVNGVRAATETYTVEFELKSPMRALRLTTLADKSLPASGPGRSDNGNFVMTQLLVEVKRPGSTQWEKQKLASAEADFSQATFPIANAIDDNRSTGWAIFPAVGKDHVALFRLGAPLTPEAAGTQVRVTLDFQSQFGGHQFGVFRLDTTSNASAGLGDSLSAEMQAILAKEPGKRSDAERVQLQSFYRRFVSPTMMKSAEALQIAQSKRDSLNKSIRSTMVMQDMPKPRETFVLMRGAYDKPGAKVTADVPSFLPPLPAGSPHNRLDLAKWLIDPNHPLMARVTVNRYWQMLFGTGLVKTVEDFGLQGDAPTHPELLDYLAVEFRESGWDTKKLIRDLVTSQTYRQTSKVELEQRKHDPENRQLARGSRFRMQAEFIRDCTLDASGLLYRKIGGESVSPYQPTGIWEELASRADGDNWTAQKYSQSHGADLYRRTMYTFWKRTAPPPSLMTFDAPDRETCTVRRARTNTPLQALVLMNDPTYVEAARHLAERVLRERSVDQDRTEHLFKVTLSRGPSAKEQAAVAQMLERLKARYAAQPTEAEKLLKVGESPRDERFSQADAAAWTMVTSAILNLDEFVNRN